MRNATILTIMLFGLFLIASCGTGALDSQEGLEILEEETFIVESDEVDSNLKFAKPADKGKPPPDSDQAFADCLEECDNQGCFDDDGACQFSISCSPRRGGECHCNLDSVTCL